jgi:hypothetical protein
VSVIEPLADTGKESESVADPVSVIDPEPDVDAAPAL